MASPSYLHMKPELAADGTMKSMVIRIIGFVNTPEETPEGALPSDKMNLTHVCDYEMKVTSETTMRDIKDFALARLTSLRYYQLTLEFWNKNLKDSTTMKDVIKEWPLFMTVRCIHLHIIVPDEMFKAMYKTFRDMGVNEEKALAQTKSFLDTYQNKRADFEYDIAVRLEKCRVRLLKHGIKITNPEFTLCE